MAKVNMPLLSGEVHGKVGEIVFFKRYGKQLARMRVKPTNPRTEKQTAIRQDLSGLSKLWKGEDSITLKKYNSSTGHYDSVVVNNGLTETEKEAWRTYAMNRGKPSIYGRLLFIGENIRRLISGLNIIRTPE
jgi:hypothetical protein